MSGQLPLLHLGEIQQLSKSNNDDDIFLIPKQCCLLQRARTYDDFSFTPINPTNNDENDSHGRRQIIYSPGSVSAFPAAAATKQIDHLGNYNNSDSHNNVNDNISTFSSPDSTPRCVDNYFTAATHTSDNNDIDTSYLSYFLTIDDTDDGPIEPLSCNQKILQPALACDEDNLEEFLDKECACGNGGAGETQRGWEYMYGSSGRKGGDGGIVDDGRNDDEMTDNLESTIDHRHDFTQNNQGNHHDDVGEDKIMNADNLLDNQSPTHRMKQQNVIMNTDDHDNQSPICRIRLQYQQQHQHRQQKVEDEEQIDQTITMDCRSSSINNNNEPLTSLCGHQLSLGIDFWHCFR